MTDPEIDEHVKLYGKRAEDLRYGEETCPRCKTRIDEIGWCGCDTIGGD